MDEDDGSADDQVGDGTLDLRQAPWETGKDWVIEDALELGYSKGGKGKVKAAGVVSLRVRWHAPKARQEAAAEEAAAQGGRGSAPHSKGLTSYRVTVTVVEGRRLKKIPG